MFLVSIDEMTYIDTDVSGLEGPGILGKCGIVKSLSKLIVEIHVQIRDSPLVRATRIGAQLTDGLWTYAKFTWFRFQGDPAPVSSTTTASQASERGP